MGLFPSSSSSGKDQGNGESNRALLYLNIYDLTPINNYLYWFGLGIFHSGIEVLWCEIKPYISHGIRSSTLQVALDFVSPENVGECLRLTKEFRVLPPNHRANEYKLEIKKMILHAMQEAAKILDLDSKHK